MTVIEALRAREWTWKEGFKLHCETCGAEFREKHPPAKLKHKPGCEYFALIQRILTDPNFPD